MFLLTKCAFAIHTPSLIFLLKFAPDNPPSLSLSSLRPAEPAMQFRIINDNEEIKVLLMGVSKENPSPPGHRE